jgi:hypothetical protein
VHRIVQHFLRDSILSDEEIAALLWDGSSRDVQQEIQDFIAVKVRSQFPEDIHSGIESAVALRQQLPLGFRTQILFGLLERRFRRLEVRLDIFWLVRTFNDELEPEEKEAVIRYMLKESRSARPELQEAAAGVLSYQARIYGRSGTRTRNMITRRLIALADNEVDAVSDASVAAIARFAPFVPPRYHTEAASILMSQIPPRRQAGGDQVSQALCADVVRALGDDTQGIVHFGPVGTTSLPATWLACQAAPHQPDQALAMQVSDGLHLIQ